MGRASQLGSYLLVTASLVSATAPCFSLSACSSKIPLSPSCDYGWKRLLNLSCLGSEAQHHFLSKHLCQFPAYRGPLAIFTVVSEPVSPFIAVLGLLCLTIAILALSCFLIHRMEITYTAD